MKYQLILILTIFITGLNYCIAQSKGNFGLQFSPGIALQKRHSEPSKQIRVSPKLGFKSGVFYQFNFNQHFGLETSLNYTFLKNSTTSKAVDKNAKYKFGMYNSGFQLSVMLQYQTELRDNLLIRSGIGSSVNYVMKDDFYFEDLDYFNSILVKRKHNYQINSSVGIIKKESKFYFGVQLDLGLFINYVEDMEIQNHQATYWIKSSSAFFVIKYYPFLKEKNQ
jgi:opacity protein-like surface antigen